MGRLKTMLRDEFRPVLEKRWEPVVLQGEAIPRFAERIPACAIIASGQYTNAAPLPEGGCSKSWVEGGIDVYRESPDDPCELNKDWYRVFGPGEDRGVLLVEGPLKDDEHWLDEIPARYEDAQVIGSTEEDDT